MKQQRLQFAGRERKSASNTALRNDFDRRNLMTAEEILRDIDAHGGPEAFPVVWARMVIERLRQSGVAA